jgi:FtsH-binding integral membrane protein
MYSSCLVLTSITIYGGISAMVFSGYLVYDTDKLIKHYMCDEYIWAAIALYLDIINLFLAILRLLKGSKN